MKISIARALVCLLAIVGFRAAVLPSYPGSKL